MIAKIGEIQAPDNARVHLMLHVSHLKKFLSPTTAMGTFLECDTQGLIVVEPIKLLGRKIVKQQNRIRVLGLI